MHGHLPEQGLEDHIFLRVHPGILPGSLRVLQRLLILAGQALDPCVASDLKIVMMSIKKPWEPLYRPLHAAMARMLHALPIGSTLVMDYRLDESRLPPIERAMMQFTAHVMAVGRAQCALLRQTP